MQPTQAQFDAIHTRKNAIVVAGAGSGKTRVLVQRYLSLLDENPDWSLNSLVAITFTRKAAGEMRDRVRSQLEQNRHAAQLADDTKTMKRWSNLLSQMDSARITTIHALCADLLRANAAEAELDPDFTVLDETEAAILLSDVLDEAFARLRELDVEGNPSPALAVFEYYDLKTIRDALTGGDLLSQGLEDAPDDWMAHWTAQWEEAFVDSLNRLLSNPLFMEAASWSLPDGFPQGDKLTDVWVKVQLCLDGLRNSDDPRACFEFLDDLANRAIKLTGGSPKAWGGKEIFEEAKDALKFIRLAAQEAHEAVGEIPGELDTLAASLIPAWQMLIRHVQTTYQEVKTRQSALDFNDLELLTAKLLQEKPDVVARYQEGEIFHLLVDEFQDTNAAQWTIAQQLAGLERPGSLFVVGDPKQSIYAFRGADVSVFNTVKAQITGLGGDQINLSRSFRTHAPLVNRFNTVFQHVLSVNEFSPVRAYQVELGEPMDAHRPTPPHDAPILEIVQIDEDIAKGANLHPREWEAYEIAQQIKRLKTEVFRVYDKESNTVKDFDYGDVAILLQTMTHVDVYESALRAEGIPFITVAGRGYYGRQEVHDLLNLLKALYNPADNLSLASALRSPLFNLSDDCLLALRVLRDEHNQTPLLWESLALPNNLIPADERDKVQFAYQTLQKLYTLAGRVTISELLRVVLADTGYLATLTGLPDGIVRRGNVEKLLHKAQSSGKITLSDFTAYVGELSDREVREGDAPQEVAGVVRLMTVHASKGLEFPVVVLVDSGKKRRNNRSEILTYKDGFCCKVYDSEGNWYEPFAFKRAKNLNKEREEAEKRRLFYVAATRAQDLLIMSGTVKEDNAGEWLGWLIEALPQDDSAVYRYTPTTPPVEVNQREVRRETTEAFSRNPFPRVNPVEPELLSEVPPRKQRQARHLSAASIADLGGCFYADDEDEAQAARDRFRRKVLYEAPATIQRVEGYRLGALHVGDIVHEALRWWTFPFDEMDSDTRRNLLISYAWEKGVTDNEARDLAVERAEDLLLKFSQSALYRAILESQKAGKPIYRELPFIYERETHIVHGVMDILFQRPNGEWVLADYKTSRLRRSVGQASVYERLTLHAKRYHLQVGTYAEAVSRHLRGVIPEVFIHYITYATSIPVPQDVWQQALVDGLGAPIRQVIQS
jgi:ATP-dependent helicase/nuclease subunit A